jgi:hypothetical protein
MSQEEPAGTQLNIGCISMKCGMPAGGGELSEFTQLVFIVAEHQVNGVFPCIQQGTESAEPGHISHEEQVGAIRCPRRFQRKQQVGFVVMYI